MLFQLTCEHIVETIGSISPFPVLLTDPNFLRKIKYSEDCFITEWTTITVGIDSKFVSKSINEIEKNVNIKLKVIYFNNQSTTDYLEFTAEPKRIIPKKFPFRNHGNLVIPSNIPMFIEFLKRSKFIKCLGLHIERNTTEMVLPVGPSTSALAQLRDELIENEMFPFLNGGTFLGWYRECSMIPHTKDMDMAVFAENWNQTFLDKIGRNQSSFEIGRKLGMLSDSFELTLYPKNGVTIYIDLFLMYKEVSNDNRWVGGMSPDGQKFKFTYVAYDPWCSADLHGHLFWVSCTPRKKVEEEYGKLWYQDSPTLNYSWSSSGKKNGKWTRNQMKDVNKVYKYFEQS
ncbi:unnamed protein product [Caenorhabditis brenneri]